MNCNKLPTINEFIEYTVLFVFCLSLLSARTLRSVKNMNELRNAMLYLLFEMNTVTVRCFLLRLSSVCSVLSSVKTYELLKVEYLTRGIVCQYILVQ